MMKNGSPNRRPVIVAAVAASFLMLVFGIGYRVLAARLAAPVNATALSAEELQRLPLQIGGWTGQEMPLDEAIVRATDTDAYINRRYSRNNGFESVWLYIAYGVKPRDLMPHRPEVCYTGAGWTLTDRRSVELPVNDAVKLPCNILQFSRGALNTQKVVILDYYLVDGQYCADVSLLRSKAWRGSGTVRYAVQVQIGTPITATVNAETAAKTVCDFAVESAAPISGLFKNTEENHSSDGLREPLSGE